MSVNNEKRYTSRNEEGLYRKYFMFAMNITQRHKDKYSYWYICLYYEHKQ